MPKPALIYARTIVAIGLAIAAAAALQWQSANGAAFAICLALALFASTQKLKVAGLTETLSPGFLFLLISIATLSWTESVAIAVASGLVQSLWKAKSRPSALQIGFAAGTMAISGGLTHAVTWGLVAVRGMDNMPLILGVSGVVLLVTNTLIVSTVLCLIREGPFDTVWRLVQSRAVPYYLAGGLLANVWARTPITAASGGAVLAAISAYLLHLCLREVDALVSQREQRVC